MSRVNYNVVLFCVSVVGETTKTWQSSTSWQLRVDMPWVCKGRRVTLCLHLPRNRAQEVGRCATAETRETGVEIGTVHPLVLPLPWRIHTTFWCMAKGTSIAHNSQKWQASKQLFSPYAESPTNTYRNLLKAKRQNGELTMVTTHTHCHQTTVFHSSKI